VDTKYSLATGPHQSLRILARLIVRRHLKTIDPPGVDRINPAEQDVKEKNSENLPNQ